MPWLVQHKCYPEQTEPVAYSMVAASADGTPVTRAFCPACKEEVVFLGHDFFKEAHGVSAKGPSVNLPPGFVIAHSRKQ